MSESSDPMLVTLENCLIQGGKEPKGHSQNRFLDDKFLNDPFYALLDLMEMTFSMVI